MQQYARLKQILRTYLIEEEGYENRAYPDTLGHWTVGVGHLLGRSLFEVRFSDNIVEAILAEDLDVALKAATKIFPTFPLFSVKRQMAIVSMIFQLGETKFLRFKDTIKAINAGQWARAAFYALDSNWAKQTPARAQRVAAMLKDG